MFNDRFLTSPRYARLFNTLVPIVILSLIGLGWYIVYAQARSTEATMITSFQYTELKLMQSVARSIREMVSERVELHGIQGREQIEQEIFEKYIQPLRLLKSGDAWIYAPDQVVFDLSSDFPQEYRGKSMAQIFELQKEKGASHYEAMTNDVSEAREGVGWYIWLPEKGREIAAWTPIHFGDYVWTIGISTPLNEILESTGVNAQRRTSFLLMSLATLITLILLAIWWLSTMRRVRAEQALKINQEALRQTQKLESLGVMAGGIAHDFNNLLVAMLGQSSLAMRKLTKEHPAHPHVEKMIKAAERASSLTQQLLAYAGKTQIKPHLLDVNELILDNLRLFEITIPATVDLQQNLTPDLPKIEADTGQIQQVLMNLIMNSAEAIGDRIGTVTVQTSVMTVVEGQSIYSQATGSTVSAGEYAVIEISDTGIGMDDKTVKRIFDPFFTTKATGRGLGLAAVLGIVRGHHGYLIVDSKLGYGTTFRLFLPTKKISTQAETITLPATNHSSATPSMITSSIVHHPIVHHKSVLLIDDDESSREFGTNILQSQGISVVTAESGQTGLTLFQLHRNTISLIILDSLMPGLSCKETLIRLRELDSDIPILIVSGAKDRALTSGLLQNGATGFLVKPFTTDHLLEEIQRYQNVRVRPAAH